jgi:hypothetical protein
VLLEVGLGLVVGSLLEVGLLSAPSTSTTEIEDGASSLTRLNGDAEAVLFRKHIAKSRGVSRHVVISMPN